MPTVGGQSVPKTSQPASRPQEGSRWFDIVQQLKQIQQAPHGEPQAQGPHSDLSVCSTVSAAIQAAEADPEWAESGVVGHLQNALDIAQNGDCRGCTQAALGLTGFVSIAARKTQQPGAAGSRQSSDAAPARLASSDNLPWMQQEEEPHIHKSRSWDACTLGTDALHTREESSAGGGSDGHPTGVGCSGSAAASAASGGEGRGSPRGQPPVPPERALLKSTSDPGNEDSRPSKRQRGCSPPLVSRSLSDPGTIRRTRSASFDISQAAGGGDTQPSGGSSDQLWTAEVGGGAAAVSGSAASDEGFPGHNSVEDVHPDSRLLHQAKNESEDGSAARSYWAGKVKHRLGASTVELFFLSALLPSAVIEHMPGSLFVTDLVQRNRQRTSSISSTPNSAVSMRRSLAISSVHTVIRCRLDFLTNRQLRKLRTLAELRLAAVSSLQHCAITLVPYLDAQRGLRIIGFVKVDKN